MGIGLNLKPLAALAPNKRVNLFFEALKLGIVRLLKGIMETKGCFVYSGLFLGYMPTRAYSVPSALNLYIAHLPPSLCQFAVLKLM